MTIDDLSLCRAVPAPRGCGEREPGGCYVESGVGPNGFALEHVLFDPPLPLPPGLDLANKTHILPRIRNGVQEQDESGRGIFDLYMHIGEAFYPFAPDYLEETRRLGASRRLSPHLDLTLLTRASRMVLAHPKAIARNWQDLQPPARCNKGRPRHDRASLATLADDFPHLEQHDGPCLFKLWELIPPEQAQVREEHEGRPSLFLRRCGSTVYAYTPTNEPVTAWTEAFLAALPLTGFSLIQYADGSVNEQAKQKLHRAQEKNGEMSLPVYETPR